MADDYFEILASIADDILSIAGESAVYAGTSVTVVETSLSERTTNVPGLSIPAYTIIVPSSEVTRPRPGDKVTFRNESLVVSGFPPPKSVGGMWQVNLVLETLRTS